MEGTGSCAYFWLLCADINAAASSNMYTALHCAVEGNHLKVIKMLLARGAYPNRKGNHGWTPVARACFYKQVDVVRMLLEHSSIVDGSAFRAAARCGCFDAAALLVKNGGDIQAAVNECPENKIGSRSDKRLQRWAKLLHPEPSTAS